MKFESKFGVGEIVIYQPHERMDALLEVQGIYFEINGNIRYICRYPGSGVTVDFSENQLKGDPEFNQDSGYPVEKKE